MRDGLLEPTTLDPVFWGGKHQHLGICHIIFQMVVRLTEILSGVSGDDGRAPD